MVPIVTTVLQRLGQEAAFCQTQCCNYPLLKKASYHGVSKLGVQWNLLKLRSGTWQSVTRERPSFVRLRAPCRLTLTYYDTRNSNRFCKIRGSGTRWGAFSFLIILRSGAPFRKTGSSCVRLRSTVLEKLIVTRPVKTFRASYDIRGFCVSR